MNTKGIKFLAVLAVLAMAFAVFAVVGVQESQDAAEIIDDEKFANDNVAIEVNVGDEAFHMYVNKSADVTATYTAGDKPTIAITGTIPYVNGEEYIGSAGDKISKLFGTNADGKAGYIVFNKTDATTNFTQTGNATLAEVYPGHATTKTSTLDDDKAVVVLVNTNNSFEAQFDDGVTYKIDLSGLKVGGNVVATGEKGETYTIDFPGNSYEYASGAVSGVGVNNTQTDARSCMVGIPEASIYSYALIGIDGMTSKVKNASSESANTVKILSENSTWQYFSTTYGGIDTDKSTRERTFAIANDAFADSDGDHYLSVMIPQDKSSVKLTFTYYKTETPGTIKTTDKAIATTTFTIDFAEAYTAVTLPGDSVETTGYVYDYSTGSKVLTLTNYNGNATFYGAITQVTLSGENKIDIDGVPYGIWSTTDMVIKPVEGSGSLDILLNDQNKNEFNDVVALYVEGELKIEGSDINIVVDSFDETDAKDTYVGGIVATGVNIYESTLSVNLDTTKQSYGVLTLVGVEIKSSKLIDITAMYGLAVYSAWFKLPYEDLSIAASNVNIESSVCAIYADDISVTKNTILIASAAIVIPDMPGPACGIVASSLSAESDSIVTVDNLRLEPTAENTKSTNNATINVTEDLIVDENALLINKSEFNVGGKTLVIGNIDNQGSFNATGDVTISKFKNDLSDTTIFPTFEIINGADDDYFAKTITITDLELNADYTAYVKATVTFAPKKTGAEFPKENVEGTAVINTSGEITSMDLYVLSENDGTSYLATISVSWQSYTTSDPTPVPAYKYVADTNGQVYDDGLKTVVPSDKKGLAKDQALVILEDGAISKLIVSAGVFTAEAGITVNTVQATLVNGGEIVGDVEANEKITVAKGKITGDVKLAQAISLDDVAITIAKDGTIEGDIELAKNGNVAITGTLEGDIVSKDAKSTVTVLGKVAGDFIIEGKYKSSSTATEADTDYKSVISLNIQNKADGPATVLKAMGEAKNGTTPGYLAVTVAGAVAKDKSSAIVVEEGIFAFDETLTIPSAFDFTAEPGTTVNVKSSKIVTITGAIIIKDGATFNVYDSEKKVYNYGKIDNEITFAVEPNTYYCSFEYALGNAPEGTPLEVTKDVTIEKDVNVKKDVVITVDENKTVTFKTYSLSMAEGAAFILEDGAAVNFEKTGANKKVSGTFTYGLNGIKLADVVFDTASSITATKASGSATFDKMTVNFAGYNAGAIDLVLGDIAGSVVFKDTGDAGKETTGAFTIGALASYYGTFTYDAAKKAKIVNNGEYAPTADVPAIDVAWSGTGFITLTEGKKISIAHVANPNATKVLKQNMTIVYGDNTLTLKDAFTATEAITISAVKASSTVPAHLLLSDKTGALYGEYTLVGNLEIGDGELAEKAKLFGEADSVISIIASKTFKATGLLEVGGTINKKTETVTTYGALSYQVEYIDGIYTVYTQLGTAITEGGVTDMTISENITLTGGTAEVPKNLGDVTLEVVDGKKLTVKGYVTIGTASTEALGGLSGIVGNVVIDEGGVLIVYDNALINADKVFTNAEMTTKAKKSVFFVEISGAGYATVFNDGSAKLTDVEKSLSPSFDGYKFTGYSNYVPGKNFVGETDVAILLEAEKVVVILTKAIGLTYYVNNIAYQQTGVPVELKVGDVVSATIDSGYTGTPKVNGQDYVVVDPYIDTITATGAQPIPEPEPTPTPEPEPAVDGISLTDILLIVLVVLIAIMVVILILRLNRS